MIWGNTLALGNVPSVVLTNGKKIQLKFPAHEKPLNYYLETSHFLTRSPSAHHRLVAILVQLVLVS